MRHSDQIIRETFYVNNIHSVPNLNSPFLSIKVAKIMDTKIAKIKSFVWNTVYGAHWRWCFERNIQSRKSRTRMKEKFVKSFSLYNWKKEDHLGRYGAQQKTLPFDGFCHAKDEIQFFKIATFSENDFFFFLENKYSLLRSGKCVTKANFSAISLLP